MLRRLKATALCTATVLFVGAFTGSAAADTGDLLHRVQLTETDTLRALNDPGINVPTPGTNVFTRMRTMSRNPGDVEEQNLDLATGTTAMDQSAAEVIHE